MPSSETCHVLGGGTYRLLALGATRRKFTAEYKAEAVELAINSGRPIAEIARDLGINEGTLGNWVKMAKKRGDVKEKR
jgi:transposase